MQASVPAALPLGALLTTALWVTPPMAQTSAAPLREQEPRGLFGPDEVRRRLDGASSDEAPRGIGRTVRMNVVVDEAERVLSDLPAEERADGCEQRSTRSENDE